MTTRRDFLKHSALGAAGLTIGGLGFSTGIYNRLLLNILYVINQKYGLNL